MYASFIPTLSFTEKLNVDFELILAHKFRQTQSPISNPTTTAREAVRQNTNFDHHDIQESLSKSDYSTSRTIISSKSITVPLNKEITKLYI